MVCDHVVPPGEIEQAIDRVIADFTGSGVVSAAGNGRALRVGEEPLDMFRRYMGSILASKLIAISARR